MSKISTLKFLFISLLLIGFGAFTLTFANTPPPGPSGPNIQGTQVDGHAEPNTQDCEIGPGGFRNQNLCSAPGVPTVRNEVYNEDDFEAGTDGGGRQALLAVKNVINRVLGLLAFIALIILIYTGIVMLINARDSKKLEEGYTTVKNVAIALVFIGVSWLIISLIFRVIGVVTDS